MRLGPAYRILTPRLVIRCYELEDAPLLLEAVNSSANHLKPWMPWAYDEPRTLDGQLDLVRKFRGNFDLGNDLVYAIFDRTETRFLGGCGLHLRVGDDAREIGYWLRKDATGQGYMTETVCALTRVGFEVEGLHHIEIHMDVENHASAAVPPRAGYTCEGKLRGRTHNGLGDYRDIWVWTMFVEEYPDSPAARLELQALDGLGRRLL
jgi:RimJ/RimL family protein N-acetyltransferase